MKWQIPAKTFFLGEYVAITGGPALLVTTSPCFELTLSPQPGLSGIHPESPAGKLWKQTDIHTHGLQWRDPYQGLGGLGASSAQFIGAYLAIKHLQNIPPCAEELLVKYYKIAWQGNGLRPSGYDLLAQSLGGFVSINQNKGEKESYTWLFVDVAFILMHTGKKLPTHEHLYTAQLPKSLTPLGDIVKIAKHALATADSEAIIAMVNAYQQQLEQLNLVAEHSLEIIRCLQNDTNILAIKGCGALGADVLLLLVRPNHLQVMVEKISRLGFTVLSTSEDLYTNRALIENKPTKTLEI